MIRIVFLEEGDRLIGFEARGHAGYAEYGADIVCGDVQPLGMHMNYGGGQGGFTSRVPRPYHNQIRQRNAPPSCIGFRYYSMNPSAGKERLRRPGPYFVV